eukprot:359459-Chlamydomonas_euryale.AAC.9
MDRFHAFSPSLPHAVLLRVEMFTPLLTSLWWAQIRSLPEGARPSPLGNDAPAVVDMRLREGILRESLGGTLTMVVRLSRG